MKNMKAFLGKGVLKLSIKFTGENPCRSVISLQTTLRLACSLVNLLHIFRTPFYKITRQGLLLDFFRKQLTAKLRKIP